ncbi:MAG: hypothetical protein A2622_05400 [Bdellovibrionales bacterium RIFCSPHIGHO2_01_FULL_40_29]|nr:MAG: hypothetical protein A2622_05400 [Bdellovibrionales bacterium RIFCSPHIGHO2_01_FULL_40_29]OFZ33164.1 MAG: hypothetical protein A3D17_13470 [Bdellovibrionales bacterium RIFCSPHIGHO2_02_FULL_40_15]
MLKNKISSLFFCIYLVLTGCQSSDFVISETLLSAREHRRIILSVIGDARLVSQNGREMYSHYHDSKFKFLDDPTKVKTRYYSKVVILGARRPYDISVEVRRESKDPDSKQFIDQGLDEGLSRKRLDELKVLLNQSRESSQEFDVENPF